MVRFVIGVLDVPYTAMPNALPLFSDVVVML